MNPTKVSFTKKQLKALDFAIKAHGTQRRKGTHAPYILHPMEVAYLCGIYYPDEKDIIIAAYLHDLIEDTDIGSLQIKEEFGEEIANLVLGVTHISPTYLTWKQHRTQQIIKVSGASLNVKRLKAADMLSNATSIARDFRAQGMATFDKFKKASHADYVWYYDSMLNVFIDHLPIGDLIVPELKFQINEWRYGE